MVDVGSILVSTEWLEKRKSKGLFTTLDLPQRQGKLS